MNLVLRFILGGILVSVFAVLGDSFKPKTFAGIFGAAPSVAIAGLALIALGHDKNYIQENARAMMAGAAAMVVYSVVCLYFVCRTRVKPWVAAGALWVVWCAVAFWGFWALLR